MQDFKLIVNGTETTVSADPSASLLSVLREQLHLTGAKYACGSRNAVLARYSSEAKRYVPGISGRDVGQHDVQTIEGLSNGAHLHAVQQAFLDASAFQCGFCTPGMIMDGCAAQPEPETERRGSSDGIGS